MPRIVLIKMDHPHLLGRVFFHGTLGNDQRLTDNCTNV